MTETVSPTMDITVVAPNDEDPTRSITSDGIYRPLDPQAPRAPIGGWVDGSLFALLRRKKGWDDDYLAEINDPTHGPLQDVDRMAEALHRVRVAGEQIVVLPDFDMDGVTSGTLGWAGLNELGFDAALYVPDYRRGHDISVEAVRELRAQFPRATTIITCDGGINSNEGIAAAKALGLTALVTDHHMELEPGSVADVAVNPVRIGETYAHPGICGAYVLHQVLMAYAQRYAPEKVGAISLLKLFAGIGTVSDVMPLFYENRKMVRDSLSIARLLYVSIPFEDRVTQYDVEKSILMSLLRSKDHHPAYVSAFEGFALAMKAFREHGKLRSAYDLDEQFYAFYLSPAFNAIRRVSGSMHDAFGAFTAPTAEAKEAHIEAVIECNERRKLMTDEYMAKLWDDEQPLAHMGVFFTDAPTGMLGLIASKIMRESDKPTIIVRRPSSPGGPVGGSARSPFWFPVISTMTPHGFTAVGHENACGVRVASLDELVRFAEIMNEEAALIHNQMMVSGELDEAGKAALVLGPDEDCDADLIDVEAMMDLAQGIDSLAPYGHGFPRPEIELVVDLSRCAVSTLGSEDTHLKIVLPIGMKMLWWNSADRLGDIRELAESTTPGRSVVRAKVKLSINVFRGHSSVQAVVESLDLPGEEEPVGADWGEE